jgi:copper oxidase (laccase) domain-containing protein
MNHRVPEGTRLAAQALLAEANRSFVEQVHQIVLRDVDANEDKPRLLTLMPLGDVIGVAITEDGVFPQDKDILFVSASAFGNCLPALGFTGRAPAFFLVPPSKVETGVGKS